MVWLYVLVGTLTGGDCYSGAPGKSGHYEFSYEDPTLFGPVRFPPLVEGGARATIDASPTGSGCGNHHPFSAVASSDAAIATFAYDGNAITVSTGRAGTAELQLLDDTGAIVDRVDVRVEAVAELGLYRKSAGLLAGETYTLPITMYGTTGVELGGERGMLQATASGSLAVTSEEGFLATTLQVTANEVGEGAIALAAPSGITDTISLTAVDETAIASIVLDPRYPPTYDADHVRWTIHTVASTAAGDPVFGAKCHWQLSGSSLSLDWERPAQNLADSSASEDSAFRLGDRGSFTATCTIGGAHLDVPLQR